MFCGWGALEIFLRPGLKNICLRKTRRRGAAQNAKRPSSASFVSKWRLVERFYALTDASDFGRASCQCGWKGCPLAMTP
jgi:hypothetical protein